MKFVTRFANALYALVLFASGAYLVFSWQKLPAEIVSHYMISGAPKGYGAAWRLIAFYAVAVFIGLVHATLMLLMKRVKGENLSRGLELAYEDIRLALWFVDFGASLLLLYIIGCSSRLAPISPWVIVGILVVMSIGFLGSIVSWVMRKRD